MRENRTYGSIGGARTCSAPPRAYLTYLWHFANILLKRRNFHPKGSKHIEYEMVRRASIAGHAGPRYRGGSYLSEGTGPASTQAPKSTSQTTSKSGLMVEREAWQSASVSQDMTLITARTS